MGKDYIRGPWHVGPVDDTCITDDNGEAVAYVEGDYDASQDEMEARARLIAAAPELLEALEALFESYKSLADSGDAGFWALEDLEEGQAAIAAIRKAKGAFDPAPPKYPDKASSTPVDHISGQRIRERERRY